MKTIHTMSQADLLDIINNKDQQIAKLQAEISQLQAHFDGVKENKDMVFTLKNIIEEMPGNVFWKTVDGKYLGCNKNVANFLGLTSPDDIIGKTNQDILTPEIAKPLDEEEKNIESLEGKYIEQLGLDANQNPTVFLTQRIPLRNIAGKIEGILGIAFDISERKRMEEELKITKARAEASNQAKTRFLATMNHELRTPLTSIIGLVNLLKQTETSVEERQIMVSDLQNCAEHLLNLVNDILDFSKVESGKYKINVDAVAIEKLIKEVSTILNPLATQKGLAIKFIRGENVPSVIYSDYRLLCQILINLANNAIKFTERGTISVHLLSTSINPTRCQFQFKVIDTGIGMAPHQILSIFEPFHQLEDIYTRQSSRRGTGLGLTIVKTMATLLGMSVQVNSEVGKGSIFTVTGEFDCSSEARLAESFKLDNENIKQLASLPTKKKTLRPTKPFVLLIEDDKIVQYVHKKMLENLGCEVDAVSDGKQVLSMQKAYDILFVDISLPDISGIEIIRLLRNRNETAFTPIVALTAYAGKDEKMACLNAGANEFAIKPISEDNLHQLLTHYLDKPVEQIDD